MKSIAEVNHARTVLSESEKVVEKIIEFEILDVFWFEVLRRHPDLQLDAQGCKLSLPRNNNTSNCLSRTSNVVVGDVVADLVGMKELICTTDIGGVIRLCDGQNMLEHSHINLFLLNVSRDMTLEDGPGPITLSPLCNFRIYCAQILSTATQSTCGDKMSIHKFRHSRFIVVNIVLPEIVVEDGAPVDPKKKKPAGGAKGAQPIEAEKKLFYRILIVDAIGAVSVGKIHFELEVVHELLIDCASSVLVPTENSNQKFDLGLSVNTLKEMFDGLSLDLSLDGALLSVVCSSFRGGCKVYSLLQRDVNLQSGDVAVDAVATSTPDGGSGCIAPLHLARTTLVAIIPSSSSFLAGGQIKCAAVLPSHNASGKFGDVQEISLCRLLITLQKASRCVVVGFRAKSSVELAALQQQAVNAASAAAGKGAKGAAPPPPLDDIPSFDVCLLSQWSLSDALTAFCLDPHTRTLLVLGSRDGTVQLWNMESLSLIDTLGRHKNSPITCVSVKRAPWAPTAALCAAGVTVMSGSLDGTFCVYSASNSDRPGCSSHCGEHVRLSDYRFDAANAAVLRIQQVHVRPDDLPDLSTSLALVDYSSGLVAVYEIPSDGSVTLLGRLEKRERVDYKSVYSSIYSWKSLPAFEDPVKKIAFLKAAEEAAAVAAQEAEAARLLAIQQAAVEAEKAAKAGKGKPAHVEVVPEPVAELSAPEAEPEQPYQYVPQPPELREDQIDAIPHSEVMASALADGGSSSQWQAYRPILSLSGSNVVCSCERDGTPSLVAYSLSALVSSNRSATAVTGGSAMVSSASTSLHLQEGISKHKSSAASLSRTADVRPAQHLKLTEGRLLSLEKSFLPPVHKVPSKQQFPQHSASLDPAALMRASISRSRQEKQARKGVFLSNAATLSTLFQEPSPQR